MPSEHPSLLSCCGACLALVDSGSLAYLPLLSGHMAKCLSNSRTSGTHQQFEVVAVQMATPICLCSLATGRIAKRATHGLQLSTFRFFVDGTHDLDLQMLICYPPFRKLLCPLSLPLGKLPCFPTSGARSSGVNAQVRFVTWTTEATKVSITSHPTS